MFNNDNTPPVNSLGFDLQFDNTVIQFINYTSNEIGTSNSNIGGGNLLSPGIVRFGWYSYTGDGASNVTAGVSPLVQISFRAIKPASSSTLHFTNIVFSDRDANLIMVTGTDGSFSVSPVPGKGANFTATITTSSYTAINNSAAMPSIEITPPMQASQEPTENVLNLQTTEPAHGIMTTSPTAAQFSGQSEYIQVNQTSAQANASATAEENQRSILDVIIDFFKRLFSWK
jgi:hypothetical protein